MTRDGLQHFPVDRQLDLMQRVGRVGYWEFHPATGEFWLPPASLRLLAKITGRSAVTATTLFDVLPDGERERFREALRQAAEAALPLHQELRLAAGAGHIDIAGEAIADADGARYAGTFQDISRIKDVEEEREEVINQLNALLGSLRVGVTVFDHDLHLIFWNDLVTDILGLPRGAVYKYARFEDLLLHPARRGEYGPGDPETLVRQRAELARRFEAHRFERPASGGRVLLVEGYPFTLSGEVMGFVTTYTDITAQKRIEEKLVHQNTVLSTIIDNFPGAVSLFDSNLHLAAHNEQFKHLLELPDELFETSQIYFEDLVRHNARRGEYGPGDVEEQVAAMVARARNPQPHKIERVRPNGQALEIRGMPLPDGGFVTAYIDITERKRAEERIRAMALQDTLTGLPNRLHLNEKIEMAIERAALPFALLFLDLDGFKRVNDSLGHDAGDELLVKVARALRAVLRETDVVARLGGDEFVVLLHDIEDSSIVDEIASQITNLIGVPFALTRGEARIGASVGIAIFPEDGATRETLLRAADEAMYEAKKSGRGTWWRYPCGARVDSA